MAFFDSLRAGLQKTWQMCYKYLHAAEKDIGQEHTHTHTYPLHAEQTMSMEVQKLLISHQVIISISIDVQN